MTVGSRWLDWLYERLGVSPPVVVDVLIAVGIVLASWIVGRWVVRASGRTVARRFARPSVTRVVLLLFRGGIVAVGVAAAATIVGFDPGEILLSVTVFSAVLAVVLAPIVRRFIGGMFVLADQPYEIGDMIELVDTDTRGFVEDVTLRYTKLFTLRNTLMVIPNSEVLGRDIINLSAGDARVRDEIGIVVTYEGDLDRGREAITAATAGVDGVIGGGPAIRIGSQRYPAEPRCQIDAFGDHGVALTLRYWAHEPYHLPAVRSRVQGAIRDALADERVEFAYPHSHVVFDETSGRMRVEFGGDERPEGRADEPRGTGRVDDGSRRDRDGDQAG